MEPFENQKEKAPNSQSGESESDEDEIITEQSKTLGEKLTSFEVDESLLQKPSNLSETQIFASMDDLFKAYEQKCRIGTVVIICHHDTLIDAIKNGMGEIEQPDGKKGCPDFNPEDLKVLGEIGGKMIEKYSEKDKKKMAALMGALVDLLVYDLEK